MKIYFYSTLEQCFPQSFQGPLSQVVSVGKSILEKTLDDPNVHPNRWKALDHVIQVIEKYLGGLQRMYATALDFMRTHYLQQSRHTLPFEQVCPTQTEIWVGFNTIQPDCVMYYTPRTEKIYAGYGFFDYLEGNFDDSMESLMIEGFIHELCHAIRHKLGYSQSFTLTHKNLCAALLEYWMQLGSTEEKIYAARNPCLFRYLSNLFRGNAPVLDRSMSQFCSDDELDDREEINQFGDICNSFADDPPLARVLDLLMQHWELYLTGEEAPAYFAEAAYRIQNCDHLRSLPNAMAFEMEMSHLDFGYCLTFDQDRSFLPSDPVPLRAVTDRCLEALKKLKHDRS